MHPPKGPDSLRIFWSIINVVHHHRPGGMVHDRPPGLSLAWSFGEQVQLGIEMNTPAFEGFVWECWLHCT